MTKIIRIGSHFVVLLKSDLDIQQTHFRGSEPGSLNKSSCLATALGVTKLLLSQILFWSQFVVLFKYDLGVQQTHLRLVCWTSK